MDADDGPTHQEVTAAVGQMLNVADRLDDWGRTWEAEAMRGCAVALGEAFAAIAGGADLAQSLERIRHAADSALEIMLRNQDG